MPSPRLARRTRWPRWFAASLLAGLAIDGLAAEVPSAETILQDLRHFRQMGTVLYVAAHPDDENTELITYLARGRGYRTAYLSLTRGDGGQNLLGPEFGSELGMARTQELLAARRVDGGRQFFSRAIDFGFSKDFQETLNIWNKQAVLSDIVRVIRIFQPDVIITRFSTQPGGTHGHHTASAVLALEAFQLAGDAQAFPEQLDALTPWQPKRILQNGRSFGRGGGRGNSPDALQIEIGGEDAVTGESFATIAGRSRAMHKTQGFGNFGGGRRGGGPRTESFQLLAGEPALEDIFDGVATTWDRVGGGAPIDHLTQEVIAKFDLQDPSASVPGLLALRRQIAALPSDPLVEDKRRELDRIIQACLGLEVESSSSLAEVVPGETFNLKHVARIQSSVPVKWLAARYPKAAHPMSESINLSAGHPSVRETACTLPADTPVSQPYWLREDPDIGIFRVADASLIGLPENPPVFPIEHVFEIGGQTLVIPDEPVFFVSKQGGAANESRHRLNVIPPISLRFSSRVELFRPGGTRQIEVEISASRRDVAGTLSLDAPGGWTVTPSMQSFRLTAVGDRLRKSFTVEAPQKPDISNITARARIGDASYDNERVEIRYDHIPPQLLQPPARLKAVSLNLDIRGQHIGYIPGAGDSIAEGLEQMGYRVTSITGEDLTEERLKAFDAVVFGIRAFNVRDDLESKLPALFAYVEQGGNVVVQYNRPNGLRAEKIAPYDLRLSNDRVTDETAAIQLLAPDHPALSGPNKISAADFAGWVQERGLYFPNQWDKRFTPLIACSDPGEEPLSGGILVARYGRGYFVYTGMAWFRQLPAGVPGAFRLFANLVSLGK